MIDIHINRILQRLDRYIQIYIGNIFMLEIHINRILQRLDRNIHRKYIYNRNTYQ